MPHGGDIDSVLFFLDKDGKLATIKLSTRARVTCRTVRPTETMRGFCVRLQRVVDGMARAAAQFTYHSLGLDRVTAHFLATCLLGMIRTASMTRPRPVSTSACIEPLSERIMAFPGL